MLSNGDLERLIAEKRHEIEKEKIVLGLAEASSVCHKDKEDNVIPRRDKAVAVGERAKKERESERHVSFAKQGEEKTQEIPPDLEKYIRRYLGLPAMLRAGEYSPNNPLVRGAPPEPGDALLGIGEYERRRHTLRRLRQQQYREYLDQQAKKKQEAKEQAEKERREREEKERLREEELEQRRREYEQNSLQERRAVARREQDSIFERRERVRREEDENRRASVCYVQAVSNTSPFRDKVDTGVQVELSRPLSVAVQTDEAELYRLPPSPTKFQLTQAERELSPRTVGAPRAPRAAPRWLGRDKDVDRSTVVAGRRRSYGDFDDRTPALKSSRDKLVSDLRHTYMPSIFDAEAIHMRNLQAEKEAAERRQYYQQELKNQIREQQRIREERKSREKMLEQAEMRRLEEQLRMLRMAQDVEVGKQRDINAAMKESASDYDMRRLKLQKEIDLENQKLRTHKRNVTTSYSDTVVKLPTFYTREERKLPFTTRERKLPFSTNIPDNSIFSPNYDVDSYLRKNLNPKKEILKSTFDQHPNIDRVISYENLDGKSSSVFENDDDKQSSVYENFDKASTFDGVDNKVKENGCDTLNRENVIIEKAIVHDRPKDKSERVRPKYEPSCLKKYEDIDDNPIPVLRHSPKVESSVNKEDLSKGMQIVDDKWKVPVVQKNILKSLPNEEGKNMSILTQLGSIRRQLQLEQLKLDNMSKSHV